MNVERDAAIETCLKTLCTLDNGDDAYDAVRHVVFQMFMTAPGWRETWPAFVMGIQHQFDRADILQSKPAGHA
jgi:hypothetical protein